MQARNSANKKNELKFNTVYNIKNLSSDTILLLSAFSKEGNNKDKSSSLQISHWPKDLIKSFEAVNSNDSFSGSKGETFQFNDSNGKTYLAIGLGDKSQLNAEILRKEMAKTYKSLSQVYQKVSIDFDGFTIKKNIETTTSAICESLGMTSYQYNRHKSTKKNHKLTEFEFLTKQTKSAAKGLEKAIDNAAKLTSSINIARDFINEPPNILNSVHYAKLVEKDAASLKRVKVKVLGKTELKKEKMNLFLSVNNASAHDARLVHLTYTPAKATKNTKHIVLVGKGLTFDTGGYSLKPPASMINMKFDMGGSATVYGAFRAAALLEANVKITCILGLTDNAINNLATMPDAVFTARNGKTVEILNTDAEGRLVLADCLDYACDLKPDAIIDAATLTGACLMALGTEVCAIMGNNDKLRDGIQKSAKQTDEYIWPLPIIDEFREDIKSPIADLKNIGGSRFAGTPKAAAFLEEFIKNDIPWAHLDIAGVADSQGHLPYCPKKGASGLMIRTLTQYLLNAK